MWLILLLFRLPPKVAVTAADPVNVTLQPAAPVHAPDQLANTLLGAGVSVSVTAVLGGNVTEHPVLAPEVQITPAGLLLTVPEPAPAVVTVNTSPTVTLKVAVTVVAAVIVTVQVPVPVQPPPDHPPKADPVPAAAVSVTALFGGKLAEHVPVVQLIPAGVLETVPVPSPDRVTLNTPPAVNVALTVIFPVIVTVQVMPEHPPPLKPPKVKFAPGVALRVTLVPDAKLAVHVVGQLIPAGALVTVPVPVFVTVNWKVPGGVVEPEPEPPQPASSRDKAKSGIKQQVDEAFMAHDS
jgi:hypothetical protein